MRANSLLLVCLSLAICGCRTPFGDDSATISVAGQDPASLPEQVVRPDPRPGLATDSEAEAGPQQPSNSMFDRLKAYTPWAADKETAEKAMQEGHRLFREKDFDGAAGQFSKAAKKWPDSALEEDALFMTGESYFFGDRYPKAVKAYESTLKKYENTRHLDTLVRRLFLIARFWEKSAKEHGRWALNPNLTDRTEPLFDTRGEALKVYQIIRLYDPTGPLADDSVMATAVAYMDQGWYQEADVYFETLRKEYPRSEHQPNAHLLSVHAKMENYQGPKYDGDDLKEAEKVLKSTLVQFPTELKNERSELLQEQERIRLMQAERDYRMAEYYHRRSKWRAARIYYQMIVQNYPDTPFAVRAREKLAALQDKPAEAQEPLKWLARPFKILEGKDKF